MNENVTTLLVIAVAIFLGQYLYNRFLIPTPKEEVKQKTYSGDNVRDFLDNF